MPKHLFVHTTGHDIPNGMLAYEKDLPGWMIRVAINPDETHRDPIQLGFRLSKDQDAQVYSILRPDGDDEEDEKKKAVTDALIEGHTGQAGEPQRLRRKKLDEMRSFAHNHTRLIEEGRVPEEVANHRLAVCTGVTPDGIRVSDTCSRYRAEEKGWGTGHCKGCGCPDWPVSQMRVEGILLKLSCGLVPGKAYFPMGCPIGKFSEHAGRRVLKNTEQGPTMEDGHESR